MSTDPSVEHSKRPLQPGDWFRDRAAGVLLHPTALPGPGGGRLGEPAHNFINFLAAAGVSVWQTLPLGPVNDSRSPYQPLSLLAGNTAMINPAVMVEEALLPHDFDITEPIRACCREAWDTLRSVGHHPLQSRFEDFCERERDWLDDHTLFLVLDRHLGEPDWTYWAHELRDREPGAITRARKTLDDEIRFEKFMQWQFRRQWRHLRHHANSAGVRIFGDLPFYPSLHSADVWLEPELFQLSKDGKPLFIGGTPPDAFSETGQSWGTPLYDWEAHVAQDFRWWVKRLHARLGRFDLLRIDHFRGFLESWAIPADAESAAEGQWQAVPGERLLRTLANELPELELVAEDLGYITADVLALRDDIGVPGMAVFQFAFDGKPENPYLPANVPEWSVYYTGTHDNETLHGWWSALDRTHRQRVSQVLGPGDEREPWSLLRPVFASRSGLAIAPLQDFLGLGEDARFNVPGTAHGNWQWQLDENWHDDALALAMREFLETCDRVQGVHA